MDRIQRSDPFWLSLPIRKDRLPNELNDVTQLWEAAKELNHPMNQSSPTFFATEFGSINGDGHPTSFSSPILGMLNASFTSIIEPRILPLVELIKSFGLVTYSSCEGHLIHNAMYEAHTGFLYNRKNRQEVSGLVSSARASGFAPFRTWLTDSLNAHKYETVEIYFPWSNHTEIVQYHSSLMECTDSLRRCMARSVRANAGNPNEVRPHLV